MVEPFGRANPDMTPLERGSPVMSDTITGDPSEFTLETLASAGARVEIAPRTLRRYVAEGRLPGYRIGKTLRVRPQDVNGLFSRSWAVA